MMSTVPFVTFVLFVVSRLLAKADYGAKKPDTSIIKSVVADE